MSTSLIFWIVYNRALVTVAVVAFAAAVVLLWKWMYAIENFKNLLRNPAKTHATLSNFVPALGLITLGVVILIGPASTRKTFDEKLDHMADLYLANYSDEEGRFQVGTQEEVIEPHQTKMSGIYSDETNPDFKAWLGETLVIDTFMEWGSFIGNLSDDINVIAEEIIYSNTFFPENIAEPQYFLLSKPGIQRFTEVGGSDIYGFDRLPPKSVEVPVFIDKEARHWDVDARTDGELMKKLLEGLGK